MASVEQNFALELQRQIASGVVGTPASVAAATQRIQGAGPTPIAQFSNGHVPPADVSPGTIVGPGTMPEAQGEEMFWGALIMGALGWAFGALFDDDGNGGGGGIDQIPDMGGSGGSQLVPQQGGGVVKGQPNWEAFAEFGGLGKEGGEGWIHSGRTTDGTGTISAETFRGWDPIQQKYYQLSGKNPYSNITLLPGRVLPGIGGFITKTWVTHAWRKDGSLASTQMAMTSTGRMISLSETGIMKNWRPYKSIVIGKSLTTSNLRRVSTRVKSHTKSLKKILKILK